MGQEAFVKKMRVQSVKEIAVITAGWKEIVINNAEVNSTHLKMSGNHGRNEFEGSYDKEQMLRR